MMEDSAQEKPELPPAESLPDYKPADLNSRMLAAVLDMGLVMLLLWPALIYVSNRIFGPFDPNQLVAAFSALPDIATFKSRLIESGILVRYIGDSVAQVIVVGIFIVPLWVKVGATPGKYLLRMRVVDSETLKTLSYPRAALRYACYASAVLSLGIGVLWIGFNKKKRGFHDLLAGTRVIILPKGQTLKS